MMELALIIWLYLRTADALRIGACPSLVLGAFTAFTFVLLPSVFVAGLHAYELGLRSEERKIADLRARQEAEDALV